MAENSESGGALQGYRVLDLARGGYGLCGRILGDLGSEVIRVERPEGDADRNIGHFYRNVTDREKSLFWFHFNANKKGITLNFETQDGRRLLERLVETADFLVESFQPGYLDGLGLGYQHLREINRRLIMTSITPFGQTGPKAKHLSSDLVCWASSGALWIMGVPDREPIQVAPFQASLNAGAEAATASLIALWDREAHGGGQHVDVSVQEACVQMVSYYPETWQGLHVEPERVGIYWPTGVGIKRRLIFPCRDGFVCFTVQGGTAGIRASMDALVRWMKEEGMAPEWLYRYDWQKDYDALKLTQEEANRLEEPFAEFFLTKPKNELFERANRENIMLAPVNSIPDVLENIQLRHRGFWTDVWHSDLETNLTYPGAFAKLTETPCKIRLRAPLVGEHNQEIYISELGLSTEKLEILKATGTI